MATNEPTKPETSECPHPQAETQQLFFTPTFSDLREANEVRSVPVRSRWQLIVWPLVFLMSLFYALPRDLPFTRFLDSGPFPTASLPVQNLWITIVPSLYLSTYLFMSTVISPTLTRRRLASQKLLARQRRKRDPIELLMWLPFIWLIPVNWPAVGIDWRPTSGQCLWAAFAPWSLYFAAFSIVLRSRRNSQTAITWKRTPSLHRPNQVQINSSVLATDDGVVAHQFRWPHFKKYGESDNLLLLVTEDGQTLFLPKRAIADQMQMNVIKMIIHDNIADGSFAPQMQAFPVAQRAQPILEPNDSVETSPV